MLDCFIGGESQSDGIEVNYLFPLDRYPTLTLGAYNKIGAENTRVDNGVPRDFSKFSFLARPATFFSLNDSNSRARVRLKGGFWETPLSSWKTIQPLVFWAFF